MPENKAKIAVSIDADLARRIDAVCEARDENRSQVVQRIIREGIDEEEKYIQGMENPLIRGILETMTSSPKVLRLMAEIVGEELTEDRLLDIQEGTKKQAQRGRERKQAKKKVRSGQVSPA
ncbi:MAG: hypothetical protein AAGA25_09915 [Planctomycetota bacterium]